MNRKLFVALACLATLAGALLPPPARAQVTAGSVAGVVRDATQAVVPGVRVAIQNERTGASYETLTNEQGRFTFPVVAVGSYSFTAELSGFKTTRGDFVVELGSRTNLNILLELGGAEETVTVTAVATPVETRSAQIGENFTAREAVDLPLPAANVNFLALLSPATVDINTTGLTRGQLLNRVSSPVGGAVGAVGGSRARNNSFNLDGVDNNDPIGTGPQGSVIQDAVAEVSILKNQVSAEFGQATGGQFNIVTKTGTNEFHGNGFYYHQNRSLNAADFLTQQAIQAGRIDEKPPYDYNRFGATLGGPIVGSKLLFFTAGEYEKVQGAGTTTGFVFPTEPGYNLLASLGPGVTRQGTVARVSPFVLDFLRRWGLTAPTALTPANWPLVLGTRIPVGSVSQNIPSFTTNRRFLFNLDWHAGTRDRAQLRFNFDRGPNGVSRGFPKEALNAEREVRNYLVSLTHVHTFSERLLNEVRLAYHRQVTDHKVVDPAAAGIPNIQVAEIPLSIGPPGGVPQGSLNNIYQLYDSLSFSSGRHFWKFGVDLRNNLVNDVGFVSARGNYRWVNFEEFLIDIPPTQVGQRGLGGPTRTLSNYFLNLFAQDELSLTDTLTLNLGLRYEFNSLPRDLALQEAGSLASVPGVIEFRRPTVEKNNWAPRVGFAWDVFGNGRTALTGGYGLSYNLIFGAFVGGGELPAALQQVFFSNFCLPNCPIPVPTENFLQNGGIPPQLIPLDTPQGARAATQSYVPDQERPRIHTFTVGLEHEIVPGWTAAVRYLRTEGRKLSVQAQLNAGLVPPREAFLPMWFSPAEVPSQAVLNTLPTLDQFLARVTRPFDQHGFRGSTLTTHLPLGESSYNGVSGEIERRFADGLSFNVNYTWSRLYDHATNEFFNSFMNPRRPSDWRNLDNEWARSVLDVPHRVVVRGVWDLPWHREQAGIGRLLGGWTLSGVYVYQSGQPWTPLSQTNALGNGDVQVQRAIINPNATSATGTRSNPVRNSAGQIVGYVAADPNARYVQAGVGTFPTAGRNSLRAPGINNLDLLVSKDIPLDAGRRLQFQAHVYNLLNHPQFTAANLLAVDPGLGLNYAFVGSAGFNAIERAGGTGGARIVQLVLKFYF